MKTQPKTHTFDTFPNFEIDVNIDGARIYDSGVGIIDSGARIYDSGAVDIDVNLKSWKCSRKYVHEKRNKTNTLYDSSVELSCDVLAIFFMDLSAKTPTFPDSAPNRGDDRF